MKKYILNPKLTDDEIQIKIEKYNGNCNDCDDEFDIDYYEDLEAEDGTYTDQMYGAECEFFYIGFGDGGVDRNHCFEIIDWNAPITSLFVFGDEVERLISFGLVRKNEVDEYNRRSDIECEILLKPYLDIGLIIEVEESNE